MEIMAKGLAKAAREVRTNGLISPTKRTTGFIGPAKETKRAGIKLSER